MSLKICQPPVQHQPPGIRADDETWKEGGKEGGEGRRKGNKAAGMCGGCSHGNTRPPVK